MGRAGSGARAFRERRRADRGEVLSPSFRQRALQRHDPALLARSSEEFGLAAKLGNDPWFEKARAENDKLANRVKSGR